ACNQLWPRDGRRQRNLSLNQIVFIKQGQLLLARSERAPCKVTRVELWRQAAAPTSYGMRECWQSPRLAFPVPWQQCRGLKNSSNVGLLENLLIARSEERRVGKEGR